MNKLDFNNKYKDYIERDFRGLEFNISECIEYLDNKFQEIIKKYPDFKFKQIKVKFNWYCFYSNLPTEVENEITKELLKIHPL